MRLRSFEISLSNDNNGSNLDLMEIDEKKGVFKLSFDNYYMFYPSNFVTLSEIYNCPESKLIKHKQRVKVKNSSEDALEFMLIKPY